MNTFEISPEELERLLKIQEEREDPWFMLKSLERCLHADLRRFAIFEEDTDPGVKAYAQGTSNSFYFAHTDVSQFLSEENLKKFIVHFL